MYKMHFFMNTVHFEIFLSKNYNLFVIFKYSTIYYLKIA